MMAYIKINKKYFFSNLDYFTSVVGDKRKLSIALKDNAYGHGIEVIAKLCIEYGIEHVFVRDLREAKIIEKFGFKSIQVLYGIPKRVTNYLISINSLEDLIKIPSTSIVELKIDTGMHRNGILPKDVNKSIELIKEKRLRLYGVFSHFCCADEDEKITKNQEKIFLETVDSFRENYDDNFEIHIANTAGVHIVNSSNYDRVRIGIGAYGYADIQNINHFLKPVLSLYAEKLSTRVLVKDEHIGYGSKAYIVKKDNFKVSNYDIGYGNGFFRLNEKQHCILPNGKQILGRVSMDSFSIEGDFDEVCVFDNVSELSHIHNTISYEILTQLSPYIQRVTDAN
jgi:alanine racemase